MRRPCFLLLLIAGCGSTTSPPPPAEDAPQRAELEFLAGNYARAAHLCEQALTTAGVDRRGGILLQMGKCRLGAGDPEGAIRALTDALACGPTPEQKAEIHYRRSAAHNALWRPAEALADLRAVADAPPSVRGAAVRSDEFLYRLAVTTLRAGDWKGGKKLLQEVATKFPDTREAADAKDRLALSEFRVQIARMRDPKGMPGDPVQSVSGDYLVLVGRFTRFADAVAEMERLRASGHPDAFVVP